MDNTIFAIIIGVCLGFFVGLFCAEGYFLENKYNQICKDTYFELKNSYIDDQIAKWKLEDEMMQRRSTWKP